LPDTLKTTLINEHQLASHHAEILTEEKSYGVDYISLSKNVENKKELADLVVLKLLPEAKEKGISITKVLTQSQIAELISLISEGKISKSAAYQNLLPELLTNQNESVAKLAASLNLLTSENQDFVDAIIDKIMADFPDKVKEYKSGKKGLIGFFVGQVVKEAGGKADPKLVNEKVSKALS
ncbi:MAG: Asp-tRNA(Asn)/Glu-tRNA(Gln) amidotransferase GatCAB subunit B, partial [Saprospiraceae bacterium]